MKLSTLATILILLCMVGAVSAEQYTLYAGQTHEVGYIEVTSNGGLTVNYVMDPPNTLMESHWTFLTVAPPIIPPGTKNKDAKEIIKSNAWYLHNWINQAGNPMNGQFPWEDGDTADYSDLIAAHGGALTSIEPPFYIAAHGVVDICEIEPVSLPPDEEYCVDIAASVLSDTRRDTLGEPSYFDVMFSDTSSSDIMLGTWYDAWCANLYASITSGEQYCSISFSEASPCINYVLNNIDYFESEYGASWNEIQGVIWYLMDGASYEDITDETGSLWRPGDDFDEDIFDDVVADIEENCCDFELSCDDVRGIIVEIPDYQDLLIAVDVDCECYSETCWAANDGPLEIQFPGNNWATYVMFDPAA